MVHKKLNKNSDGLHNMNCKHKDSLFKIAFREKEKLLELYNAINNSDYDNPTELTVYTLEDVIFMGIKNDISFLVGEVLNLYEHQSTENPNMPIRGLMYFAENYESYIAGNNLDIYGRVLQKLPFPQYYILYNGVKEAEDRKVLELKDAFPKLEGMEPCLNCKATLLNINFGHNREIMARSQTLMDYSVYIQRIRDNKSSGISIFEAVDRATEDCIRDGILKDILVKNSAEVKRMVLGAWGTENHLKKQREELEQVERENEKLRQETAKLKEKSFGLKKEANKLKKETTGLKQEKSELKEENNELKNRSAAIDLLTQKLLDTGKVEELKKSLNDEAYRRQLLEEYGLMPTVFQGEEGFRND
ncbi:MAG: hypothetical protein HFH13_07700 [Dorea sp.]|nr:hypothetical protein [Dorea sp.]